MAEWVWRLFDLTERECGGREAHRGHLIAHLLVIVKASLIGVDLPLAFSAVIVAV